MKCLVTGGAGFIGSNLALELEKMGNEVVVVDNLMTGTMENLDGFKGEFIEDDISKNFTYSGPLDAIFHEAAITDPRFEDDEEMMRANIAGFDTVIELAQKNGAKLVYASTAGLYGNGPTPMREDQEKEILSVYGDSKLRMDKLAETLYGKMHICGLRYFNVFGPREKHKGRPASMIYHLGLQMKDGNRPRIFTDGAQIRDHIYVKDAVLATIKALDAKSGVYNAGTGIGTSFNELVAVINRVLGTRHEPVYFEMPYDPKTYQNNTQADMQRSNSQLNFQPQYNLESGVRDYYTWLEWI